MAEITQNRHPDYPLSTPQVRGTIEVVVFLLLLVVTFLLRFSVEPFNTLFYDEAVNATLGREILGGDFSQNATAWTFGSYLYPFTAAIANQLGGEVGLRLLSAVLSTISTGLVFFTALRLFNAHTALWAMALFGLAGGSISLGQIAVYDTLGLPFLALALFFIVSSVFEQGPKQIVFLIAAGVAASLSVLSKYIGVLFLPTLFLVGLTLYLSRQQSIRSLFLIFAPVSMAILGTYFLLNREALISLLTNRNTLLFVPEDRLFIMRTVILEIGGLALGAVVGLYFAYQKAFSQPERPSPLARRLLLVLAPVLFAAMFAAPLYQMLSENIQSLWKHNIYTSVFLTPLAAYALANLIPLIRSDRFRTRVSLRIVYALAVFSFLYWFVNTGLDRNWGLQHSWPNISGALQYLKTQTIDLDTRILAEQSAVYEYYFDLGANDRDVWSNTFYMEYRDLQGLDAMLKGIADHYFDYVILDDYYTPDENPVLEQALAENGYSVVFREADPQSLSTGQIANIRIFAKSGSSS